MFVLFTAKITFKMYFHGYLWPETVKYVNGIMKAWHCALKISDQIHNTSFSSLLKNGSNKLEQESVVNMIPDMHSRHFIYP